MVLLAIWGYIDILKFMIKPEGWVGPSHEGNHGLL
jgi:hypothetical protein